MTTNIPLTAASSDDSSTPSVDMDHLYSQKAHVKDLDDFIKEKDNNKALAYWLREYEHVQHMEEAQDVRAAIHHSITEIDHKINDLLNIIIHNPKFQKLEASWRGLWFLMEQAEGTKNIKVKVLDISWAEVVKDIGRALEFDQSNLFQKVYSEEYGTPGGEPYGAIIGDYSISHKPSKKHPHDDIATLEGLAEIAAAAFSPFIASACHELFGLDTFDELGLPQNYKTIFSQQEYIKWNALRDKADSRFLGLTLPHVLMRLPYQKTPGSYKGIFFYEKPVHNGLFGHLWGNACYALGGILIREFNNVGWFGHIRGVPRDHLGGGLLTDMVVDYFTTDAEKIAFKCTTDVIITDNVEKELSEQGLIPLSQCYDVPYAAFYNNQSVQRPKHINSKEAQINARLSTMLQHVLCGSRVAHYIKVIIRDKVGSFLSAHECERYLRDWIHKYTTGNTGMDWEEQARYPLREGRVKVSEHPEKPGQYTCVIHLVPHYQIDQMVSELELITELAQPK